MKAMSTAGSISASHRPRSAASATTLAPAQDRNGSVLVWGAWGAFWTLIALNAWARWLMSDTLFGPAPIMPGDVMASGKLIGLRVLELLSTLLVLHCVWRWVWTPLRRGEGLGIEGKLLLGGIVGFSADTLLNLHDFLFAFNAHSVNLGVWTSFMPFYTGGPARYAESLLWGFPMYVYFGITASLAGGAIIQRLRSRYPDISNASALAITYLVFVCGDFVLENTIIRSTHAYMFVKTYAPLTFFAGDIHQFPLYESLCAAATSLGFTIIRLSALDHPQGLSFVERGVHRLPERIRPAARVFAVIGGCGFCFIVLYHLPFNWLGVIGDSVVQPPSYMLPG